MNDSSWEAPPQAGYWGSPDRGPAQGAGPVGPPYDAHYAQQTRPMPLVPAAPEHGGGQDVDQGAARLGG
ncbi:phosphatidate cytidylyltransferase, partial [Streptomyces sp. NPDC057433]